MKLRSPAEVKALLARRYERQRKAWLLGSGEWPMRVFLGSPIEDDALADLGLVRAWSMEWADQEPLITVERIDRSWPRIGRHNLPAYALFASPERVAETIGEVRRWSRAKRRAAELQERFPGLRSHAVLGRHFDVLADYSDDDFVRLQALLAWAQHSSGAGLYLRQLPIEGLDTKWLGSRRALARDFLLAMADVTGPADADLEALLGLRRPPARMRIRLLCPRLRAQAGGLADIEAPIEQIAALPIRPQRVIIVENLETGIALPDVSDCVCFMKLGAAVATLGAIPWLAAVPRALYWGDIDTHGFAILDQARAVLPQLESILMDARVMDEHAHLRAREPAQAALKNLRRLTVAEQETLAGLYSDRWGANPRLEQERLHWPTALEAVLSLLRDGIAQSEPLPQSA